jgi:serine/threonine-protein kinase
MRVPTFVGEGDRYKIEKEIGRGGMGCVYRARDKNTGQHVAIKILLDATNPEVQKLFDKETEILAELQHPNIIGITDRGDFRDGSTKYPFFVMPFLKGKTLQERIRSEENPLTVQEVVEIITATAGSLHAAHSRGVIHRDIKPSNIFVLESGAVVVIDFGVVHLADNRTGGTTVKGTPLYMAPELLDPKKNESPSPGSDLFSLGVVCYEAFTGKHPFARLGASDQQVLRAVIQDIPVPAFELNRNLSLVLSQVVQKSMAKERSHRYAGVREFADKLERAFRSEPLPEFDRQTIEGKLRVVREALSRGQITSANEMMRSIEEDGFIDPAITSQRQKIDQALQRKWIREQIDSARLYRDAGQQITALEKLNEVLRRYPESDEALTERDSILEERYSKLLDDAQSLVDRHLFADARVSIQEARGVLPRGTRAAELLGQLTRMEQADREIAERKATLYEEAQKASEDGRSGAALRKLEQLMEVIRQFPLSSTERDPIYRNFYEVVLEEQGRLDQASKDVRRALLAGDAAGALLICNEILSTNPGNPMFEALKFEADNKERQARIDYINQIREKREGIQDLDARVKMLQEALNQFPNDSQLAELLRSDMAKRELVQGLVSRARRSEIPGRHAAALELWQAVKECHPSYPGIDDEIPRVQKLQEAEVREDRRISLVHEIAAVLRAGDYRQAATKADAALIEFPADDELLAYHVEAKERALFAPLVQNMIADGKRLQNENNLDGALEIFRKAAELDRNNQQVRQILGEAALEKAKLSRDANDSSAAGQYFEEAKRLIPDHPDILSWKSQQPVEPNRNPSIEECLRASRELVAAGNARAALARIEQALRLYPTERQLLDELTRLRKMSDLASAEATMVESADNRSGFDSVFENPNLDERKPEPVVPPPSKGPSKISETIRACWSVVQSRINSMTTAVAEKSREWTKSDTLRPYLKPVYIVPAVLVVLTLPILVWYAVGIASAPKDGGPVGPTEIPLVVNVEPSGAEISVGGESKGTSSININRPPGKYDIKVSLLGYETKEFSIDLGPDSKPETVTLIPLPMSLYLDTPLQGGVKVFVDEAESVFSLNSDNMVVLDRIPSGTHTLKIQSPGKKTVEATLTLVPGSPPTSLIPARDQAGYLFVSAMGESLRADCNCPPGSTVKLDEEMPEPLQPGGIEKKLPQDGGLHTLEFTPGASKPQPKFSIKASATPMAMIRLYEWKAEGAPGESFEDLIRRARTQTDLKRFTQARQTLDRAKALATPNQRRDVESAEKYLRDMKENYVEAK